MIYKKSNFFNIGYKYRIGEYDIMKECTFKPSINGDVSEKELKPQLNKVPGLERFLQMKDLQKKKEIDKKKREEEVFHLEKKYTQTKHEGFTVPKPFPLSKVISFFFLNNRALKDLSGMLELAKK